MPALRLLAVLLAVALISVPTAFAQQDDDNGDSSDSSPSATTSIDPCQLVTSDEASALAGTTYTTGREETTDGGGRICVYGYQTLNVFMVLVAQAPDADTAQATWADYQGRVQDFVQKTVPAGVSVNLTANDDANLTGYDRAAVGQASESIAGRTLNISAIYLLKGSTFVSFSDLLLNQPAPTNEALESEAQTIVGRLP